MSELQYLMRLASIATKELKITAVECHGAAELFTSQLTEGFVRKGFGIYNNSDDSSGEVVWGPEGVTVATGMPIPKGSVADLPVSTDLPVYFMNTVSGENSDLRVLEIA